MAPGESFSGRKDHVRTMPTGFEPVREVLVSQREQGRPFPVAWRAALKAVEDRDRRQVLRDTRQAWQDGYERRQSKMPALT